MRLDDIVEFFGSKTALAKAIGVSESAIYRWGSEVPRGRRTSVRLAMRGRAEDLEAEAVRLRLAAREDV